MPAPRITRKNQGLWLLVIVVSVIATLLGVRNLFWIKQQVFDPGKEIQSIEPSSEIIRLT
ncbi:MAG: hypothetical protein BRC38_01495 [Cyanobacteria bacterium QH_6_48_35]|nr:MAG: hypothetical protein BRC39_09590 [Cyanobacteria bacterium QH_7_48_89]PSO68359.1 MAG: hypothetical protein BRC38_01495 [Cyanobacteria bacterium QH_6_48_35]PSO84497.1 MAG: hypothetical protein BRC41_10155 [Cyanobacteria bacterium QH_9_48_43]